MKTTKKVLLGILFGLALVLLPHLAPTAQAAEYKSGSVSAASLSNGDYVWAGVSITGVWNVNGSNVSNASFTPSTRVCITNVTLVYSFWYNISYTTAKITPALQGSVTTGNITYGSRLNQSSISGTVKYGNDTVAGSFSWNNGNTIIPAVADSGTTAYGWTFTPSSSANYNSISGTATVTVNKKAVTLTADNKSKTYGASDPTLTATAQGVVIGTPLTYTVTRAEGQNAGTYVITVTANAADNPNYDVTTNPGTFTINKKAATLTADNKQKTYGEDDPTLTATAANLVGSDTLTYTVTRAEGQNAGTYVITVTANAADNPNYNVTTNPGTFTINKKAATITADNKTKTYGASDPTLTAVVEGTVGEETLNYTLSREPGVNVGDYDIIVTLGSNPNYNITPTNAVLTIEPAPLTIKAKSLVLQVGEYVPKAPGYTVTGLIGDDVLTVEPTLTYQRNGKEVWVDNNNSGTYSIVPAGAEIANYDITYKDGRLDIEDVSVSVGGMSDSTTVSKGVVTLDYIDVDPALALMEEKAHIIVDLSAMKTAIDEVVLPAEMMAKITEAVADENSSVNGLDIVLRKATLRLDAEALAAISEQAQGGDWHVVLKTVSADSLNREKLKAVRKLNVLTTYECRMFTIVEGEEVEINPAGEIELTAQIQLRNNQKDAGVSIFSLNKAGELAEVSAVCEDAVATFSVETFGKYIAAYAAK